jgi:type 1 glutamine amidotransferase
MRLCKVLLAFALVLALAGPACSEGPREAPIKVLIVDGHNNHNWRATTPVLKKTLEPAGLFKVDVATAGADVSKFRPKFSDYQVIVSNYNGPLWSKETRKDFVDFVKNGGGFVAVHAANNSFPEWVEYNEMIGVGGWGGRNEKWGPYVRVREGKVVLDTSRGSGGSHGPRHPFVVVTQAPNHPVMKGLPPRWMHATDELYDRLRGPAKHLTVLATAFADRKMAGTGENEPMLMAIAYGKGRVFHTTLGHDVTAMRCAGFQTTLLRGTEWAATGKVTQKVPADFPGPDRVSLRP